jgi:hypothetical protein
LKYEDVSWHNGAEEYPKDLPREAAATHTGMFVVWALLAGIGSSMHAARLAALRERAVTPGAFFYEECDGKFTDEDLNGEGNPSPGRTSTRRAAVTSGTTTPCCATASPPRTTCATPGRTSTS